VGNHRSDKLFSPPENKLNFPLGASLALGSYGFTAEVDLGPLWAWGIGVSKLF